MPIIHIKTDNTVNAEIFFWKIEESITELSDIIADGGTMLSQAQERFKSTKRQCEWLATRALLMQTPYRDTGIQYCSNGQPYLENSNMHISISHTAEFVAVAIADTPIGIDIETKNRNAIAVADAFLQPHEAEMLYVNTDRDKEALRIWTAKEAAFKLFPDRSLVLKNITASLQQNSGNTSLYTITYKDGTTATCRTTEHDILVLSICTPQ
ncbi:MAG: 4'-phosphopantetheinyl transferase superfamily protein [Bacteroidaceae bacterium]|nr:4'-phosphopantetheinyl transferase superfamily protein [Bacteroidaceae bacterium]